MWDLGVNHIIINLGLFIVNLDLVFPTADGIIVNLDLVFPTTDGIIVNLDLNLPCIYRNPKFLVSTGILNSLCIEEP